MLQWNNLFLKKSLWSDRPRQIFCQLAEKKQEKKVEEKKTEFEEKLAEEDPNIKKMKIIKKKYLSNIN